MLCRSAKPARLPLALSAAALLATGSLAARADPVCGATITSSVTLTANLDCGGYGGDALTVAADNLTIDGAGFTITVNGSAWAIGGSTSGSLIENIKVAGGNGWQAANPASLPNTGGIQVTGNHNTFAHLDVSGVSGGAGLFVQGDFNAAMLITAQGRSSGYVEYGQGNSLDTADLTSSVNGVVAFGNHGTGLSLSGVTFDRNQVGLYVDHYSGTVSLTGASFLGHGGTAISLNTVAGMALAGLTLDPSYAIGIEGNSTDSLTIAGIDASGVAGVGSGIQLRQDHATSISGVIAKDRSFGIILTGAGTTIDGCDVTGSATGIQFGFGDGQPTRNITLSNNTFQFNQTGLSATFFTAPLTLTNNAFLGGGGTAIFFRYADGVTLSGLSFPASYDIALQGSSTQNLVLDQLDVSGSGAQGEGILLSQDSSSLLTRIHAVNRNVGIGVAGSGTSISGCDVSGSNNGVALGFGDGQRVHDLSVAGCTFQQAHGQTSLLLNGYNGALNVDPNNSFLGGGGTAIQLNLTSGITLANLTLPNSYTNGGILGTNTSGLTLSNLDVSGDGQGSGLFLSGDTGSTLTNITARGRVIAIGLSGPGSTVNGCDTTGSNYGFLLGFGDGRPVSGMSISGCTFDANSYAIYAIQYSGTIASLSSNQFLGGNQGIFLSNSANVTLSDLTFPTTYSGGAIAGYNTAGLVLNNIVASGTGSGVGINLDQDSGSHITNLIAHGRATGISVNGQGAVIEGGDLSGSTAGVSISGPATVKNLVADGAGGVGVILVASGAGRSLISGVSAKNRDTGLSVQNGATTIDSSDVTGSNIGIALQGGAGFVITNSLFAANASQGLWIDQGTGYLDLATDAFGAASLATSVAVRATRSTGLTLDHVAVPGGYRTGVLVQNSTNTTIQNALLRGGVYGVDSEGSVNTVVRQSSLCLHSAAGLFSTGTATGTSNYWGSLTGPRSADNSAGTGDAVGNGGGAAQPAVIPFLAAGAIAGCPQDYLQPTASAGSDQTVTATGAFATVQLDGSASSNGSSFAWSEQGAPVATGQNPSVQLAIGAHHLLLTVSGVAGSTPAQATVTITVLAGHPCDPRAVAQSFAPYQGAHGMVVFEDLWPSNGDLDFNDQVVSYNYVFLLDANNKVVSLQATFNVLAIGGTLRNGLSLQLPVARDAADSIVLTRTGGSATTIAPEPAEPGLVVPLIGDTRLLFPATPDTYVNTSPAFATLRGDALSLVIHFAAPQALNLQSAPFDLFIWQSAHPGHQIHQAQYPGTASMDKSLFATSNDNSPRLGAGPGPHFINQQGLPFALQIPEIVLWPKEKIMLSDVYPHVSDYAGWTGAPSANPFADWYSSEVDPRNAFSSGAGTAPPAPALVGGPENVLGLCQ